MYSFFFRSIPFAENCYIHLSGENLKSYLYVIAVTRFNKMPIIILILQQNHEQETSIFPNKD